MEALRKMSDSQPGPIWCLTHSGGSGSLENLANTVHFQEVGRVFGPKRNSVFGIREKAQKQFRSSWCLLCLELEFVFEYFARS